MRKNIMYTLKTALVLACVLPLAASAQEAEQPGKDTGKEFYGKPSNWRPYDQRGINVFETSKADTIAFEGVRVRLGAGFTQQFQNLKHENIVAPGLKSKNTLYALAPGFNMAQANLNLDMQLDDGIRLAVESYMSSRHHNEFWVKGGYIQFDKLPFNTPFFNKLMEVATIKIGHMELNYGDAHFRRSDGGNTLYNPFMENNIADAFATEIGGEIYLQKNGLIGMVGMTNGMIGGNVRKVAYDKAPSIYGKGGFDKQLGEKLRLRGTASYYHNGNSGRSTLYGGDRTGSNYFLVMEADSATVEGKWGVNTATAAFASGRFNPGFAREVDAIMLNAFVKYGGLELFGTYETAKGLNTGETAKRKMNQIAGDVVYRIGKKENLFVGARYNTVDARLSGYTEDVTVDRTAFAAGWFLTKSVLLKAEIVNQNYKNFKTTDIRSGGKFNGYVIEAVVGL